MSLVTIIVVLVVIGLVLYLINTYIPMARPVKTVLNVVVVFHVIFLAPECFWYCKRTYSHQITAFFNATHQSTEKIFSSPPHGLKLSQWGSLKDRFRGGTYEDKKSLVIAFHVRFHDCFGRPAIECSR